MNVRNKILISCSLIVLGVACRLLPHAWNFAPVAGIALFSGAYLGRRYGLINPVLTLFLGDLFIGFYELPVMLAVYGCLALVGLMGSYLKQNKNWEIIIAAAIASSIMFFVFTNLAVWQFSIWYKKDLTGLINCFTLALPFYRNTLIGDLFYTGVFFGSAQAIEFLVNKKKLAVSLDTKKIG